MKISNLKLLATVTGVLALLTIVSCSADIKKTIMDSFKNAPKKDMFKVYHFVYEKKYDLNSEEALRRYKIFKSNMNIIEETNSKNLEYKFGINQFTDLTPEEFKAKYLMDPSKKKTMLTEAVSNLRSESVEEGSADYFDQNADRDDETNNFENFSPIDLKNQFLNARDQGECGSCWAFSSASVVEAAHFKKTGVREYLSTQQLVDCDTGNYGCNGGTYNPAMTYIRNRGLVKESDYPYTGVKRSCNTSILTSKPNKKISSFNFCSNYSSNRKCTSTSQVYNMLVRGPLLVGIDGTVIQYYESGIYTGSCNEDNHAVVLAGYGVQNGRQFWTVRNSWGVHWGENGYIRVARNESNNFSCFLTNEAFSVTLN